LFCLHGSMWYPYARTGDWLADGANVYTHLGRSGVAVFFMITSFLFWGKLLKSRDDKVRIDWMRLFLGRIFRLTPMYLVVMAVFFLGPIVGLAWRWTLIPSVFGVMSIIVTYRVMGTVSGIDSKYGWGFPLGVLAMIWAMLRSMVVVLWQGGVVWRGTHYRLRELRRHNSPFRWEREASERRLAASLVGGGSLRRMVDGWKGKARPKR